LRGTSCGETMTVPGGAGTFALESIELSRARRTGFFHGVGVPRRYWAPTLSSSFALPRPDALSLPPFRSSRRAHNTRGVRSWLLGCLAQLGQGYAGLRSFSYVGSRPLALCVYIRWARAGAINSPRLRYELYLASFSRRPYSEASRVRNCLDLVATPRAPHVGQGLV
jgi:hypothetical protein